MSLLLSCQSLAKSFGAHNLFTGISLAFEDDERLGLIGPNGSGKSTLLKILAGLESADAGDRVVSQGVTLGYVSQVDVFADGGTVESEVVGALKHHLFEPFERETQARVMLGKVGFADPAQKVATLSGGWRKRLAIARELVRKPDLLLMDEPTNHLDLEGVLWLEDYLKTTRQAFVVVTHDRYFLENVTRRVVELDRKYPDGYFSVPGNYSEFLERRAEYMAARSSYQESLANKVRREIEWLRRKAPARTTKARARIDEAGRMMDELADMRGRGGEAARARIDFSATARRTKELIKAEGLEKSRGGRELIGGLSFTLSPGTRIGLLGANGSGKTTLLRMLVAADEPDAGAIRRADGLRVVWFDQNRERLDPQDTLQQALAPAGGDAVIYRGNSVHVASWARRFLFRAEQLGQQVGALSGGEQAKVLIARLMLEPADVLLLDEPTNDLDIPTLETLEDSLVDFPGAVVLVTHDRYMLDRVSTQVLGLDGNGGATFFADFAQWRAADEAARKSAPPREKSDKPRRQELAGKPKKLSFKEQREWDMMEERILEAEAKLAHWQGLLHDPANASDSVLLQNYSAEEAAARAEVDRLYARWADLEARLA